MDSMNCPRCANDAASVSPKRASVPAHEFHSQHIKCLFNGGVAAIGEGANHKNVYYGVHAHPPGQCFMQRVRSVSIPQRRSQRHGVLAASQVEQYVLSKTACNPHTCMNRRSRRCHHLLLRLAKPL